MNGYNTQLMYQGQKKAIALVNGEKRGFEDKVRNDLQMLTHPEQIRYVKWLSKELDFPLDPEPEEDDNPLARIVRELDVLKNAIDQ